MRTLSAAVIISVILTSAAFSLAGGTAAAFPDAGSGTEEDPFLISSAADLRNLSETHHLHDGAYYRQTADIIMDDPAGGSRMTVTVTVDSSSVMICLTPDTGPQNGRAYIIFNDDADSADWDAGFNVTFTRDVLKEKNTIVVAGYADDDYFAAAVTFENKSGQSFSFPFKGNFTPIGYPHPFIGFYDGNGYSITGLKVASFYGQKYEYAGLFSCISNSTLYNIAIKSDENNISYLISAALRIPGFENTQTPVLLSGGIAGDTWDTNVVECSVDAVVSSFIGEGFMSSATIPSILVTGGLIGSAEGGTVTDCKVSGSVSSAYIAKIGPSNNTNLQICTGGAVGSSMYTKIKCVGNTASVYSGVYCRRDGPKWEGPQQNVRIKVVSMLGGVAGDAGTEGIADSYNMGELVSVLDIDPEMTIDHFQGTQTAAGCTASGSAKNVYNTGSIRTRTSFNASASDPSAIYGTSPDAVNSYCLYGAIPFDRYSVGCSMMSVMEMSLMNFFKGWDFDRVWAISEAHPVICMRYDLIITDDSLLSGMNGPFDGIPRFSVDREYRFDGSGTLFSYTGKEGFAIGLEEGYELSEITLYTVINDRTTVLKKDGNNNYMIPSAFILSGHQELILHMDGLESFIEPPPDEKSAEVIIYQKIRSLIPVLPIIMAAVIIMTVCNAASVMSILRSCSEKDKKGRGEIK